MTKTYFEEMEISMIKKYTLDGNWNFKTDADKNGIEKKFFNMDFDDTIKLPGTTSMAKKGLPSDAKETGFLTDPYLFEGYCWYSSSVTIPDDISDKHIVLYLERTRMTKLWIDSELVGENNSLTTPHAYDITPYVKNQTFKVTILVANTDYPTKGGHLTSPDTQTNWNGILGEISIRTYDKCFIENIVTTPDIDTKSVHIKLSTSNALSETITKKATVRAVLADINGDTNTVTPETNVEITFAGGNGSFEFDYALGDDAQLWSEYNPVVYRLEITFDAENGKDKDTTTTVFGLRKFSTTETDFLINGTPTFLRGKHDGLIFPMTGAVPATVDEWIRVMKISKSYGINHYRFHTCCPPDAAFTAADLLGIYMEPQLPFWGTITTPEDENHNEEEQQYLIKEGVRMLKEFGNHPSYCMMSLGNELWGSKEKLAEIISYYKSLDNRHLYTQGSNNFQHTPVILPEDDFFVGVRLSKNRLLRGSYGMCDAPLGHIQWDEPSTTHNYDKEILPEQTGSDNAADAEEEIEIQYGTGVKKVKAAKGEGALIPHIPIVTHEIGQFAVYPNFREIEKYTGVLKARNFEVFRDRLKEKGMLDQADDFFYTSGKLSVQCYKEELEAAARSRLIAGYQILDIQDFSGQGTALVGILDAFMDSKGHVTPDEWKGFCSDAVLLAEFDKYVYTSNETFSAKLALRYYNPEKLINKKLHYELISYDFDKTDEHGDIILDNGKCIINGDVTIPDGAFELTELDTITFPFPAMEKAGIFKLVLTIPGTDITNCYEIYGYPAANDKCVCNIIKEINTSSDAITVEANDTQIKITTDFYKAKELLNNGENVLFMPNEVKESLEGFYCTDFWCYPMFRDISEWMKKPVAVGTMGLLIQNKHQALAEFPTHKYATPQWYKIVSHSHCAILDDTTDDSYRPIVQMVDNFERNHKLGILFEGKAGNGNLMICTSRLSEIADYPETKQFAKSVIDYMASKNFKPEKTLDMDKIQKVFL